MCWVSTYFSAKDLPQTSQTLGFSLACVFMCHFRSWARLYRLEQWVQACKRSAECTAMWRSRADFILKRWVQLLHWKRPVNFLSCLRWRTLLLFAIMGVAGPLCRWSVSIWRMRSCSLSNSWRHAWNMHSLRSWWVRFSVCSSSMWIRFSEYDAKTLLNHKKMEFVSNI